MSFLIPTDWLAKPEQWDIDVLDVFWAAEHVLGIDPSSIVGLWPFWEGAGNSCRDIIGSNHGSPANTTWVSDGIDIGPSESRVTASTLGVNTTSGTIILETEINWYNTDGNSHYFFDSYGGANARFLLFKAATNQIQLFTDTTLVGSTTTAMQPGRLMVAVEWGRNLVYFNNKLVLDGTDGGLGAFASTWYFGDRYINTNEALDGRIKNIFITNETLSAAVLDRIYNDPYAPIRRYPRPWVFDLGTGLTGSQSTAWRVINSSQQATAWNILKQLTQSTAWIVLTQQTQDSAWNVIGTSSQATAWNVLADGSQDSAWKILNQQVQDSAWNVLGSNEQATAWRVANEASQATAWAILAAAGTGSQATAWRIITEDGQATAWNVLASDSQATGWRIIDVADLATSWRILEATSQGTGWHVLTSSEQAAAWRVFAEDQQAAAWSILDEASLDAAWRILTAGSQDTAWAVISDIVPASILTLVAKNRTWVIDAKNKTFYLLADDKTFFLDSKTNQ